MFSLVSLSFLYPSSSHFLSIAGVVRVGPGPPSTQGSAINYSTHRGGYRISERRGGYRLTVFLVFFFIINHNFTNKVM